MDDSFKKLNGPTADGIQSDYLAKERRAAEELLNLQLGNAKKLADLRSKLLSKLVDEAKEEGKLVEDYLAEYGLQKRLDALATELNAEKKARAGQLDELQAIRQENADALAATEEKVAKLRVTQQAKEAAARKAANQAQHKAELAALKELEKARKNLTVPSANAEVSVDPIEPIDVQARVETELAIDSTGLENLSAEAIVTPKVSEITLPQTELEVTPQVSDINLPTVDITARLADLNVPDTEVKVVPEVEDINIPKTDLEVTPHLKELNIPGTEVQVDPKLTTVSVDKIPLQEANLTLHPVIDPLPDLTSKLLLTPTINPEITDQQASLELTPKVPSIKVEPVEADVKFRTKSEDLQSLKASALVTPEVGKIQDLEANATLNLDASALEGLETTVTAKVETDGSVIAPSLDVEAEADLAKSRLASVQQAHTSEADLIAFRQKSEDELIARRVSSLDQLRNTFYNLQNLIPTEIRGPEGPIDIPTDAFDDFSVELEAAFNDLQDLLSQKISVGVDIESLNSLSEQTRPETPKVPRLSGSKKERSPVADLNFKIETFKARIEDIQKVLTKSNVDVLAHASVEYDKFLASKDRRIEEFSIQQSDQILEAAKTLSAEDLEIFKQRQAQESAAFKQQLKQEEADLLAHKDTVAKKLYASQIALQTTELDVAKATLISHEVLRATHDGEMHQKHLDAIRARYDAENDLYRLSLTTEADLTQQYEDQKAKKSVDARIALEKKKQELAMANLAAQDEAYLREEALAELEERRLDKEIKAASAKAEKQKQSIKFEQNLIAIRLAGLKNNSRVPEAQKELAADPKALKAEIVKQTEASYSDEVQAEYNAGGYGDKDKADTIRAALSEAQASGTPFDPEAIKAQIEDEFRQRREKIALEVAERHANEEGSLLELFTLKQQQDAIIQGAKDAAAKKARKESDKEDEKSFKLWTKKFLELNKGKGKIGKAIAQGADLQKSLSKEGMEERYAALLEENDGDEEKAKKALHDETQAKLDGAFDAIGDFISQLQGIGKSSTKHQSSVDTRLQGLTTNEGKGGVKQILGSYWRSLSADIGFGLGASPFFLQETSEERFANLINQGIAFNVKERAFLDVLKDKVATTFNVADGTLLKLVRIQQADTSAARLGMESALTEFLNSMYATTEYMQQAAESIRSNLYEATALMGAKEATEFEFQVQKWMGSLYSVGFSNTEGLSAALGKIVAGEIEGITEGNMGNLLVMAANEAGKPIATILEKGLSAADTDDLLKSMVKYLAKLYEETKGSNVLAQQFANVYGVTASDLRAAANLAPSLDEIAGHDETFSSMLKQVEDMSKSMILRTSVGEMMENMKSNFMYSMASSLANNPVSSSLNLVANLLNDLVGGIEIPFINVYGFGFDLNATVADLMNVAALSGPILGGVGKMVAGLANLNPSNLLKSFGVEQGDNGLNVQTRGTAAGLSGGTLSGGGQSESGYVGNESSDDVKNKTISDASSGPESQVAEAKEEQENKEEARSQMIAGHIVDIYELLQEITQGAKKFHVQLDVGNNPLSWATGTWT